jgi:cytochrome c2
VTRALAALACALAVAAAAGCGGSGSHHQTVPGGNAERGERLIEKFGCGSCHTIPGIEKADGRVGPALRDFGSIRYIAGEIPNTPDNAMRWIQDPKKIEPGTVMPDLGVKPNQARDIVAYLYSHT